MANRNAKDVQRFVDNISKEVGEKAYDPTEYATKEYVDETFEKKADVVDVVANPELSGDEPDLTGLLVGETKYKVPQGGDSNEHHIELDDMSGTLDLTDLEKITYDCEPFDDAYISLCLEIQPPIVSGQTLYPDVFYITCYPNRYLSSGESSLVNFQSVDGMYNIVLEYTYDDNTGEVDGANFTVHSGAQLHHIVVSVYQDSPENISLEFTMLCDDLSVNSYVGLVNYLISKGMVGTETPDGQYITPAMAIAPTFSATYQNQPSLIKSICVNADYGQLIIVYDDISISSGEISINSQTVVVPNNENFSIYHLNDGNFWHIPSEPGE